MLVYPNIPFPMISGTNKVAAFSGTLFASIKYSRNLKLDFKFLIPLIPVALIFSWLGARTITFLNPNIIKPLVVGILIAVGAYTAFRKDLGSTDSQEQKGLTPKQITLRAITICSVIGFYDGFIGPGTGSFLIFSFVAFLGFSFVHASACSKIINLTTNVAAVVYFASKGQLLLLEATFMALSQIAGALLGAHFALLKGSLWVKRAFLIMVVILIGKLGLDLLKR